MEAASHATQGREDPLRDLLADVARGNEGALRRLHETTRRRLFALLRRLLGEDSAAEDVLAEVYVQAWRRAGNFDPARGSGWLWLVTIARRRAIDRARAAQIRTAQRLELEHERDLSDPDPTPEQHALDGEAAQRVRDAVVGLPQSQRLVLEAAFLGGQTHQEVADDLQLPLGTVKSRIRAGLAALRRSLSSEASPSRPMVPEKE